MRLRHDTGTDTRGSYLIMVATHSGDTKNIAMCLEYPQFATLARNIRARFRGIDKDDLMISLAKRLTARSGT